MQRVLLSLLLDTYFYTLLHSSEEKGRNKTPFISFQYLKCIVFVCEGNKVTFPYTEKCTAPETFCRPANTTTIHIFYGVTAKFCSEHRASMSAIK